MKDKTFTQSNKKIAHVDKEIFRYSKQPKQAKAYQPILITGK